MKNCSVEGCERQAKALGYCPMHYERFKAHGSTEDRPKPKRGPCSIDDCSSDAKTPGYCQKHYVRLKKTGSTAEVARKRKPRKPCGIEGCTDKYWGRGYCQKHAYRMEKYGEPNPEGVKVSAPKGLYLSDGITKTCSTCYEEKPVAEFGRQSVRPDGLNITCKLCMRERSLQRYQDPEVRRKSRESGARWRERNPDADADKTLRRKYGITLVDYNKLFEAQGGVCALCKKGETTKRMKKGEGRERLAVDHCHDTGRVRGLLCFKCNTAIGSLGDTEEDAQKVVEYLNKSKSTLED